MYKLTNSELVQRLSDNVFIPPDPLNVDYQEYQFWLQDGNVPDPADPLPAPEPLSPEQKLLNSGLTINDLKNLLGLSHST